MPDFKSAQLIAYHVPTFREINPGTPDASSAIGKGLRPAEQALVQRFAAVLNFSKALSEIDRTTSTLKVFIAPEFYFKTQGAHWGSFTFNTMINVLEAIKVAGSPGSDWLVVAGSVIFYLPSGVEDQPDGSKTGTKDYKHADGSAIKADESAYLNVAPILKDGGTLTYVIKREVSTIDGPPEDRAASLLTLFKPLLLNWGERKQRIFTVGNRTIGFEVCLDHLTSELKQVVDEYPANENTAAPTIDLHVVTSCGMDIKYAQARDGGYVMLCDGLGNGSESGSEMRKVAGSAPADAVGVAARHDIPAAFTVTPPSGKYLAWNGNITEQQVVIYKPVPLP